jgi:hypothetical protein
MQKLQKKIVSEKDNVLWAETVQQAAQRRCPTDRTEEMSNRPHRGDVSTFLKLKAETEAARKSGVKLFLYTSIFGKLYDGICTRAKQLHI